MSKQEQYVFPYARDAEGYPRVERAMTPEQYEEYKKAISGLEATIASNATATISEILPRVTIDSDRFKPVYQRAEEYKDIPYPSYTRDKDGKWNEDELNRKVGQYGIFPIVVYMVLNYFKKEETVKNLVGIALQGDWHHRNGTWLHYVDVVCQAYGLNVVRVTSIEQVYDCMKTKGGVTIALMKNEAFPGAIGNVPVVITAVSAEMVEFYYCGKDKMLSYDIPSFMEHTKVLWTIYE